MKISNFRKTNFLSITFPFIDDFALNIDEVLAFFDGLFWPFLAFIGLFGLCVIGQTFKAKTGLC